MNIEGFDFLLHSTEDNKLKKIIHKLKFGERIDIEDTNELFHYSDTQNLCKIAHEIKRNKYGDNVFFNRNLIIEHSNICINKCSFCSFSNSYSDSDSFENDVESILKDIKDFYPEITDIHITGGVHPDRDFVFYESLVRTIKETYPGISIKAYTAIELEYMALKSGFFMGEVIKRLKEAGLSAIPGEGAEIFNEGFSESHFAKKVKNASWIKIHEKAHSQGLHSCASMLYGSGESLEARVKHMDLLRQLQDKTKGFISFMPLKVRSSQSSSKYDEYISEDDIKTFAISRIFFDNIPHIKVLLPVFYDDTSKYLLACGVDDIDVSIFNKSRINPRTGHVAKHYSVREEEIISLIRSTGMNPVKRDSDYKIICDFKI